MNEMTPEEFWAALAPALEPEPISYRLYYDEQGRPLFYSMEKVPGNYVEIDRETYHNPPTHVRVVDGKLKISSAYVAEKLVPGNTGTPCAVTDVCVVVDPDSPHTKWALEKYESN
jgi:hypothetical protein